MELTGRGSFEALTVPDIRWPAGLRHYKPVEKWMVREDGFPQSGKKIFAIPFSGRQPGKYVLPPVAVTYFDPAAGIYRTVQSRELSVQVGGEAEGVAMTSEGAIEAERVLDRDLSRLLLLGSLAVLVVVGVMGGGSATEEKGYSGSSAGGACSQRFGATGGGGDHYR